MAEAHPLPSLSVNPGEFSLSADVPDVNLELTNPNPKWALVYKCKTTTPQRYVVRNRQGIIHAACNTRIHISLHPGATTAEVATDQFQIEYRFITPSEATLIAEGRLEVANVFNAELPKGKKRIICRLAPSATTTASTGAPQPVPSAPSVAGPRDQLEPSVASNAAATTSTPQPQQPPPATTTPSAAPQTAPASGTQRTVAFAPTEESRSPRPSTTTSRPTGTAAKPSGSPAVVITAAVLVLVLAAVGYQNLFSASNDGSSSSAEAPAEEVATAAAAAGGDAVSP